MQFTETSEAQTAGEKFTGYMYGGRPLGERSFFVPPTPSHFQPLLWRLISCWRESACCADGQMSSSTPDGTNSLATLQRVDRRHEKRCEKGVWRRGEKGQIRNRRE